MDIMYTSDGRGNWWRREWQPQCVERVYFSGQCQGTKEHEGVHWCFGPNGNFLWNNPEKDLKPTDIACGSTPPGNRGYRTPQEMRQFYHLKFSKDEEVTDPKILEMLERDKTPEDGASINRPAR